MQTFVSEHAPLRCGLRVLPADRSLADVWATSLLKPPTSAVLALDFDQTITLVRADEGGARKKVLRGCDAAREALHAMRDAGVRMVVVTAQTPSAATVENMSKEMVELGIAELFDVQPMEPAKLRAWLHETYEVVAPSVELACTRLLLLLLLLCPEKKVADFCRIGHSPTTLEASGVRYKLQGAQGWSAEQKLAANDAAPALCPVRCWKAYVELTAAQRSAGGAQDRLLLLSVEAAMKLARDALAAIGYSARDAAWLTEPHAKEVQLDGGVKLAMKGNTVAARYNKPEGLQAWMDREGLSPDKLVFVDDNSDNAFSMFLHFATLEKTHAKEGGAKPAPPSVCSIWYPPESANTEENFDKTTRELLLRLSRGRLGEAAELD